MGVKYVDNFSFPSDFGFTGSASDRSTTMVKSHERARPLRFAEGGSVPPSVGKILMKLPSKRTTAEQKLVDDYNDSKASIPVVTDHTPPPAPPPKPAGPLSNLKGVGQVALEKRMRDQGLKRGGRAHHYAKGGRVTMKVFIAENRAEIDAAIRRALNRGREKTPVETTINDKDRRDWLANDEGLYNWARSSGMKFAEGGFVDSPLERRTKPTNELDAESGGRSPLRPGFAKGGKFYVGYRKGKMETFKSLEPPTEKTYGKDYGATIGPFRTKRGAEYMAGKNRGPDAITVADAERLAKTVRKAIGGPVKAAKGGDIAQDRRMIKTAINQHVAAPKPRGHGVVSSGKMHRR